MGGNDPIEPARPTGPPGLFDPGDGDLHAGQLGSLFDPPRGSELLCAAGWFRVTPARPLRFGPFDFDVLVFPTGLVAAGLGGGASETVDPNLALLCRRGTAFLWSAPGPEPVRCGLLTPGALRGVAPLGVLAGSLRGGTPDPVTLWTFPASVYLAQRLITADGPWRRPAPMPKPSETSGAAARWRRVAGWAWDGHRRGDSILVRRLRAHLARGFARSERLSELAQRLGYSDGHLSRTFKLEMGVTLHAYRHELRMRAALDLLPSRGGELSELAFELGYASHSHFTARFLRTFGLTPSACHQLLAARTRVGSGPPGPDAARWPRRRRRKNFVVPSPRRF